MYHENGQVCVGLFLFLIFLGMFLKFDTGYSMFLSTSLSGLHGRTMSFVRRHSCGIISIQVYT